MAEEPKPITEDDEEKELLEQHGHPNAVAPSTPEPTEDDDEVKEEGIPAEVPGEEASPTLEADSGGDADSATDGAAGNAVLAEPAKVEAPASSPISPQIDQYAAAKQQIDEKIAALRAQKKAGEVDFDEANEQINDLVMKRQDLMDEKNTRQAVVAQYWSNFHEETGLSAKVGKELYAKAVKNMHAKGRYSEEAVLTEHDHLIEQAQAALKPAPVTTPRQVIKPPTSAPLPKGGVKVAPQPTGRQTIPAKTEKSDEDELLETVRKIPGGIRG